MGRKEEDNLSIYISYLLRHKPEDLELCMDQEGYVESNEMIAKINADGKYKIDIDTLKHIVESDQKQRYSFKAAANDPYKYIRANQGHSTPIVKIDFREIIPDHNLYHGTIESKLDNILKTGLQKMQRNKVHLSGDLETAKKVACRRQGNQVILEIDVEACLKNNIKFGVSDNGVYMADFIPAKFIKNIIYL